MTKKRKVARFCKELNSIERCHECRYFWSGKCPHYQKKLRKEQGK